MRPRLRLSVAAALKNRTVNGTFASIWRVVGPDFGRAPVHQSKRHLEDECGGQAFVISQHGIRRAKRRWEHRGHPAQSQKIPLQVDHLHTETCLRGSFVADVDDGPADRVRAASDMCNAFSRSDGMFTDIERIQSGHRG